MKKKLVKSKKSSSTAALYRDIWPQERDIIVRPERLRYVRKMLPSTGQCVFCEARDKGVEVESLCLYKSKNALVILNKYPYNSGHIMVLPARHCGDLTELSDDEYFEMHKLIRKIIEIIKKEYNIKGLNIGLNMGSVAGAGIPEHLHWHIIPRWHGDTNFFPLIAETKVLSQSLESVYAIYEKHFRGLVLK
jgi:ATP adenylyltransferase